MAFRQLNTVYTLILLRVTRDARFCQTVDRGTLVPNKILVYDVMLSLAISIMAKHLAKSRKTVEVKTLGEFFNSSLVSCEFSQSLMTFANSLDLR